MSKNNKKLRVAINGFGRIGRAMLKAALIKNADFDVVAINDLTDTATLAHLFRYDSCYGEYEAEIQAKGDELIIGKKRFKVLAERDPLNLPWKEMEVDVVIEATGLFRTREKVMGHIKAGAKKVIISAPGKGDGIKTIVLGVNEEKIKKTDKIISNASCTTNCLAPVTQVIKDNFGIKKAIMTTIHSYTADQRLVDAPHSDLRRARAAAINIVPTSTGAAKATAETIPALKGKFDGMAVRVPTPVASLCDVTYVTKKKVDEKTVNQILKKASQSARLKGILAVTNEPLVSSDYIGDPASTIIDTELTKVVDGDLLKIVAWYDNEWGYSNRLVDLVEYLAKKRLV